MTLVMVSALVFVFVLAKRRQMNSVYKAQRMGHTFLSFLILTARSLFQNETHLSP